MPTSSPRLNNAPHRRRGFVSLLVFLIVLFLSAWSVAGPGLTWDEPAYRYSQVRLQEWGRKIAQAPDWETRVSLFSGDAIDFYWEFNRFGPNFHPPMASYLNLITRGIFSSITDDLTSRRLASCFELAGTSALLCFMIATFWGVPAGAFAGLALAAMPRIFGDSHIAGTDIPMMFFWTATSFAFFWGLQTRGYQWLTAALLACLFLVKFSGVMITLPLAITFLGFLVMRDQRPFFGRWLLWTSAMLLGVLPCLVIAGKDILSPNDGEIPSLVELLLPHRSTLCFLLLWPLALLAIHSFRGKPEGWKPGLELPWVILSVTPLLMIAFNLTWWHDPLVKWSAFLDLNVGRKDYLPDIAIYYLGRQYLFSLPWHNAWVLMALTIPWGMLALGVIGCGRIASSPMNDGTSTTGMISPRLMGWYLVLQMATLPVVRMLPTPAHDGVRLFLPTFVYWSALAAIGAHWLAQRFHRRWLWPILFTVGPMSAGVEIALWHPYELSYYNIGLKRAQAMGMEVTYWYDAVTPAVLRDMNEGLPANAPLAFPSPLINPEVFVEYQSQGRLRPDIRLDLQGVDGFPYLLLLTHSSKATPFTRLLYAFPGWYESYLGDVRMFSIVDPQTVSIAWALHSLLMPPTQGGNSTTSPILERILEWEPARRREAIAMLVEGNPEEIRNRISKGDTVSEVLAQWTVDGQRRPELTRGESQYPESLRLAARLIEERPGDLRTILQSPGYLPPEQFGGWFAPTWNTHDAIKR